jgi:hypothetical protein
MIFGVAKVAVKCADSAVDYLVVDAATRENVVVKDPQLAHQSALSQ